ncbi:MAG: 4Fe-4S dicluster domain-containing protein [Desulfobacter sp.]|nr:MAG: 4Fe-4S dicluster domain-containing protein [Desulfobacter sp.]
MAFKIILITVCCLSFMGLIFRFITMARLGGVFERDKSPLARRLFNINYAGALFNTLFQVRLFRAGKLRWLAHALVFSGFVYLVFVHALDDWTGVVFDWYQPGIDPFRMLRNLAGVMVAAGCISFLARRMSRSRINRERLRRGLRFRVRGTLSVMVILGLISSGFFTEALNIMSEVRFNEMVEEYSGLVGEPELVHLKGYWARYYDVAFAGGISVQGVDLEAGGTLNEEYCLECHTRPAAAFVSAPLARMGGRVNRFLARFRLDRVMYWIHLGLALTLLLFLPFSRMFHIVAVPLASMGRRVGPENLGTDMGALDLAALTACTHCGFCSKVCSVYPDYQISENPQVLPHVKIETLKRLAGKGVYDINTLTQLRSGNDDCTLCGRCADICPSSIDLVRLWTAAGRLMDRLGCPDNYISAMETPFGAWMGTGDSGRPAVRPASESGAVAGDGVLSGLIFQADAFEHCVQCTLCTNACPVVAQDMADNDMGPHQIMNLLRLGEIRMASGTRMVWHCLTCYACQEICPQSIRVTDIILELRCRGQARAFELTRARLKGGL